MKKPKPPAAAAFDLEALVQSIQAVSDELARQASRSVNVCLTVRNWLIGHYIAEFELNGSDRAAYGDKLLDRLAGRLADLGVKSCDKRRLYQYLRFYQTYPEIVRALPAQSRKLLLTRHEVPPSDEKVRSLCTEKDHVLVEYALAGMDNALFVSKYQLELPSRETLQQRLEAAE